MISVGQGDGVVMKMVNAGDDEVMHTNIKLKSDIILTSMMRR